MFFLGVLGTWSEAPRWVGVWNSRAQLFPGTGHRRRLGKDAQEHAIGPLSAAGGIVERNIHNTNNASGRQGHPSNRGRARKRLARTPALP